jgi:hypothetical protein
MAASLLAVGDRPAMVILIFLVIFAAVLIGVYYAQRKLEQRTLDLSALAERLGWQFRPENDYDHDERFAQFSIFQQGHTRYAYNTLVGKIHVNGAAWPAQMGDYHYQVTNSDGKTTTTHTYRLSYLVIRLPFVRQPQLLIRREGLFDALKNLFGFDDIDFESAEFSRRFCVKSPERRFAYDVIHPRMIEFLMEYEPPTIDIEGGSCLLTDAKHTWSPEEFRATTDWAGHFFELWPAHVTSQLEHQA